MFAHLPECEFNVSKVSGFMIALKLDLAMPKTDHAKNRNEVQLHQPILTGLQTRLTLKGNVLHRYADHRQRRD